MSLWENVPKSRGNRKEGPLPWLPLTVKSCFSLHLVCHFSDFSWWSSYCFSIWIQIYQSDMVAPEKIVPVTFSRVMVLKLWTIIPKGHILGVIGQFIIACCNSRIQLGLPLLRYLYRTIDSRFLSG